MCAVLDDLVVALYVTVDELLGKRSRPGRPPRLSDAELVCLAVAQVLLGCNSERRWLRFVGHRLRHLFPYVPGQSGYNRRLRAAAPALRLTLEHLARTAPSWGDQWRLLDATPVPCGASRETVKRSDLAGWAGYGYDRSHSRWYWGLKLYLLAAPDGMPVAWGLATPKLGEREVAAALLGLASDQGLLRPGMVIAADKGLAGHRFAQGVGQLGAVLVRPDRRDEPHRWGSLGGIRQWIEGIIDTLKDQLGLERHGAHTPQGLWMRVTQRLPALAAGIWFNWQLGVADKRNLVAYDPGFKSPQLHHHRSAGQLALEAMDFGCGSCDQVDHLGQACRPARVNPPVAVKARERELALSVRRLAALDDRLSGR